MSIINTHKGFFVDKVLHILTRLWTKASGVEIDFFKKRDSQGGWRARPPFVAMRCPTRGDVTLRLEGCTLAAATDNWRG